MRRILIVMILLGAGCSYAPYQTPSLTYKMTVADIDVAATFPRQVVAGEAIPITIEVTNHREKPIVFRARRDATSFMVRVYDSNGAEVSGRAGSSMFVRENLLYGLGAEGTPPIAPGEGFRQSHELNRLYVLNKPGAYAVSIYSSADGGIVLEILNMPLQIVPQRQG